MISDCYDEIMAVPSWLQSFSEDESMTIHELSYQHAICFCIVLQILFTWLTSLALRGKAEAKFITKVGRRATSTEIAPLAILVMDGVGERRLGMITIFHRSDQAKVDTSDPLSTLVQQDSPKPDVIVVKVFTNSTHLLQRPFGFHYLDVTTLSVGALTTQFPLALLCLHRLLPHSPTQVILPWEKEGGGLTIYPVLVNTLWESSEEEHCFSSSLPLSVPIVSSHSYRDARMQTEQVIGFSLALRQLQEATHTRAQLEWRMALKPEGLLKNYEDQQFRILRKRGQMDQDGWADGHHLHRCLLSDESGKFSEASSMVSLCHCQVLYWSCMFRKWSTHFCHHFRTWQHHCPVIYKQHST